MKQDDLKFKIDQLRKDKIVYAVEATATVLTCVLIFLFVNYYLLTPVKYFLSVFVFIDMLLIFILLIYLLYRQLLPSKTKFIYLSFLFLSRYRGFVFQMVE